MDLFRQQAALRRLTCIFGREEGTRRLHELYCYLKGVQAWGGRFIVPAGMDRTLHELLAARDERGTFELVAIQHLVVEPGDRDVPNDFESVGLTFAQLVGPLAERSRALLRATGVQCADGSYEREHPACWVSVAIAA